MRCNLKDNRSASTSRDDLELVQAALAGDSLAVDSIARRLEKIAGMVQARAHVVRASITPHDCEDIAQQATLTALRRLHTFEGRSRLETWIYRICAFELYSYVRRERRRSHLFNRWAALHAIESSGESSPLGWLPGEFSALFEALEELGSPKSDVVRLRHLCGLSFREIAKVTQAPQNTIRSHYYRGIRWLKRRLQAQSHSASPA